MGARLEALRGQIPVGACALAGQLQALCGAVIHYFGEPEILRTHMTHMGQYGRHPSGEFAVDRMLSKHPCPGFHCEKPESDGAGNVPLGVPKCLYALQWTRCKFRCTDVSVELIEGWRVEGG